MMPGQRERGETRRRARGRARRARTLVRHGDCTDGRRRSAGPMVCTRERVDTRKSGETGIAVTRVVVMVIIGPRSGGLSAYEQVANTGDQARVERREAHRRTAGVGRTSSEWPRDAPTEIDHAPRDERRTHQSGTGRTLRPVTSCAMRTAPINAGEVRAELRAGEGETPPGSVTGDA